MRTFIIYLLRAFVSIVVSLGVSFVVFLFAINTDTVKAKMEAKFSEQIGAELDIAGPVMPGVSRDGVSLAMDQVTVTLPESGGVWEARQFKGTLPLSAAKEFRLTAQARGLVIDGREIGDLVMLLNLTSEAMIVEPLSGRVMGGALSGRVSYKKGYLEIHAEIAGMDYAELIEGAAAPGQAKLYIYTDGFDTRSLVSGLNGTVILRAGAGHLPGNIINLWAGDPISALARSAAAQQQTQVNCFLGEFKIRRGVAQAQKLMLDTPRATLFGTGKWNMSLNALDMMIRPETKGVKALNLGTPILLTGPIQRPQTTIAKSDIAARLGRIVAQGIDPAALAMQVMNIGTPENRCGEIAARVQQAAEKARQ